MGAWDTAASLESLLVNIHSTDREHLSTVCDRHPYRYPVKWGQLQKPGSREHWLASRLDTLPPAQRQRAMDALEGFS